MDKEKLSWRSFADHGDGGKGRTICEQWNVVGTPALFINGRMLSGNQPYSEIKEIIEDELQRSPSAK